MVIDPIDGSLNARRTIPLHSLSVAVADGDSMEDVTFGYVYEFGAGEEFVASVDGDALLDGRPLEVATGEGLEVVALEATKPERVLKAAELLQGRTYRIRVPGSIAVALCYVAAGRYDGMLTTRNARSVDAAAGQLVARCAGAALEFAGGGLGEAPLDLGARYDVAAARTADDLRCCARPKTPCMPERLVDWNLAERLALALSGSGPEWDGSEPELRAESERAARLVRRYTGLRPKGTLPEAELVDRAEWARVNLESFQDLSSRVEEHLGDRMSGSSNGRAAGIQRTIVRAATGAEVGLAVGYLSQRVIGQYDVALIGPARAPRLLFVGPNLSSARARLQVDRDLFLRWIALHETTHAVHFSSVPWLREHIGGIAEELFEKAAIEVKPAEILGKLARLNPRELVRSVKAGELATLLLPEDQRRLVDRLTATMTLVEGYAEHVMDAVGDQLDPGYGELRRALDRDRDRRGLLDSIVSKLLGLEMKLAQYRRGKAFADEVVRAPEFARSTAPGATRRRCPARTSSIAPRAGSSASARLARAAFSRSWAACNQPQGGGVRTCVRQNVCSVLACRTR